MTAALVACPPAAMEADEPTLSDAQETEEVPSGGGESGNGAAGDGGDEGRAWLDTPNADLLVALSRSVRRFVSSRGVTLRFNLCLSDRSIIDRSGLSATDGVCSSTTPVDSFLFSLWRGVCCLVYIVSRRRQVSMFIAVSKFGSMARRG